jgi:hypothetical protein
MDDGLPPHAVASSARAAVARTAATDRAGRGRARRGRRVARVLSFIMISSRGWVVLRLAAGVHRGGYFPLHRRAVRLVAG